MNILHLIHRSWPYHGGAERYVWEHALAGVSRGHSCTIATTTAWRMSGLVRKETAPLPPGRFLHRGVTILRFPVAHPPLQDFLRALLRRVMPGGPDRFFYPNPFIPSMDRWLSRARGFDIAHANAMPFLIHGGYRYSVKHRIPLVTVPHANLGSPDHRILPLCYFQGDQKKIFRNSSLMVAQNRFEASVYTGECGVDPNRVIVLGSGIQPEEWAGISRETALRVLGLAPGTPIVLSATSHCLHKGSFALLDACIRLWKTGLDFVLVLAGQVQEDFRRYLDEMAHMVPQGKLAVTGYVGEEMRKSLFCAASMVAAPSLLDAFGIVLLDGWIAGKPVIGCNAGGMPDIIDDGTDGFLVEFGDIDALSEKIGVLLKNREQAGRMGNAGREKTLGRYTWKNVTSRFYSELEGRGLCNG